MGFNAPTVTTIVVSRSEVTFNLVKPTAQGQQQAGQCGDDVSGDYKLTVDLGDGTTLVPTDTFCKSKADGIEVPFDNR